MTTGLDGSEFPLVAQHGAPDGVGAGNVGVMDQLTDFETRVLAVLEQRSGLDVEQIASAGRLPIEATTRALEGLLRRELIVKDVGKFGPTYQLDRPNVIRRLIAA